MHSLIEVKLRELGISPKHYRGQNFLVDEQYLKPMLAAAELSKEDTVVEIGPGLGVLTEKLAERAGTVIAIEIEPKFVRYLEEKFSKQANVVIVHGDARDIGVTTLLRQRVSSLKNFVPFDSRPWAKKVKNGGSGAIARYKVVANLPYSVGTHLVTKYLEENPKPERMVVMLQKEVAERIVAKRGTMSVLSVIAQFFAKTEIVASVPAKAFYQVPQVDSAIVSLTEIGKKNWGIEPQKLFKLVKVGFVSPRKLLKNNLNTVSRYAMSDSRFREIMASLGLPVTARAQELSVEEWVEFAKRLQEVT